jgi:hypothetical protein
MFSAATRPVILSSREITLGLISVISKYSSVLQSSSVITTSCATSTILLVKYPDSAVFNAVSTIPLRLP